MKQKVTRQTLELIREVKLDYDVKMRGGDINMAARTRLKMSDTVSSCKQEEI